MSRPCNALRGEFEASIAGEAYRFDTTLGTIAAIEEHCGDVAIVAIVNRAVFGRRARDHRALIAAALVGAGHDAEAADGLAGRASATEAERFILALMGALGFEIGLPRESGEPPLVGAPSGGAGGNSPLGR